MWPNPQFPADLVTFTGAILNGKLHFLCSDRNIVFLRQTKYLHFSNCNCMVIFLFDPLLTILKTLICHTKIYISVWIKIFPMHYKIFNIWYWIFFLWYSFLFWDDFFEIWLCLRRVLTLCILFWQFFCLLHWCKFQTEFY